MSTSATWEHPRLDDSRRALDRLANPATPRKPSKGRRRNSLVSAQELGTCSIRDTWLRLTLGGLFL